MAEVKSAHFVIDVNGKISGLSLKRAEGDLTQQGSARGTASIEQFGPAIEAKFVIVGSDLWLKAATGGYQKLPLAAAATVYDPSAILDPNRGVAKLLSSVKTATTQAKETLDGKALAVHVSLAWWSCGLDPAGPLRHAAVRVEDGRGVVHGGRGGQRHFLVAAGGGLQPEVGADDDELGLDRGGRTARWRRCPARSPAWVRSPSARLRLRPLILPLTSITKCADLTSAIALAPSTSRVCAAGSSAGGVLSFAVEVHR